MDVGEPPRSWWGFRPVPPEPRSIVQLVRDRTLDAQLAALLWLLVEARLPVIVAATRQRAGKTTLLEALLDFLPPATRRIDLAGVMETFDWLPHARELGWRGSAGPASEPGLRSLDPATTYLVAAELSDHTPAYTWGDHARIAIRALSIGYGLGATIHADSLEEVLDALHQSPVALTDDELSRLGVVLFLRLMPPPPGDAYAGPLRRVTSAHYVRPLSRDEHGHLQRLGPAVLATWNEASDTFEHFAWGVVTELADRVGRRPGDFEAEIGRRAEYLAGLASAGVVEPSDVRAAIEGFRAVGQRGISG
jgi:hypothetical protein